MFIKEGEEGSFGRQPISMPLKKRKRHLFDKVFIMSAQTPLFPHDTNRTSPAPMLPTQADTRAAFGKVRKGSLSNELPLSEHRYHYYSDEHADDRSDELVDDGDTIKSLVDRHLLLYKGFYFLFFGAVGSLFPYLAVFYKQLYLSAQQVGFLIGVRPFIQMLAGPLWGALADTYNVKKIILLLSIAAWLGTNYSISFVRRDPNSKECKSNISYIRFPEFAKVQNGGAQQGNVRKLSTQLNSENNTRTNRTQSTSLNMTLVKVLSKVKTMNSSMLEKILQLRKRHERSAENITIHKEAGKLLRSRRGKDFTSRKMDDFWEEYTPYNITHGEGLLPMQRLLAADELEEEFDSLNTDDAYPWPLDSIENSRSVEQVKNYRASKEAMRIFVALIVLTVLGTILASPAATLADTATLQNLGEQSLS